MADFLKNKAKLIILAYGVVLFIVLLFGLYFMTQYAHVHIAYSLAGEKVSYSSDLIIGSFGENTYLFQYFAPWPSGGTDTTSTVLQGITRSSTAVVDAGYADIIYKFQTDMSSFNSLIIVLELVSIICFAVMLIFSNQSRKIYYKDNLAVGILMPLIVIVLNLVLMINVFSLMSTFNSNVDLFKVTSFYMNPDVLPTEKQKAMSEGGFRDVISSSTSNVNSLMFVIAIILFVIVMAVSVLMMVYTVYRYKECAKRRNEIIERAANKND